MGRSAGPWWTHLDPQILLKIGSSVWSPSRLPEGWRMEGCTTVTKFCSNHPEPTRCEPVIVERAVQRQALSRLPGQANLARAARTT